MIELRHIAHLLAACEHENLTRAAEDLGLAPSTLSASLKALETEVGFSLFKRLGSGLYPRASARWLFRAGLPLLLLERHARRGVQGEGDPPRSVLQVRVGLKFTIGRISKAVLRAIARTEREAPGVLVHPVWTDDDPTPFGADWDAGLGLAGSGALALEMIEPGAEPGDDETLLLRDSWVLACRMPVEDTAPLELAQRMVMTPPMRGSMSEAIQAHLARAGVRRTQVFQDHPGSLPRLAAENPDAAFLLPRCAIADRLGLAHVTATALDPPLITTLVARGDLNDTITAGFLARLQGALVEEDRPIAFPPELTSRRLRYFNLTHRLRSVSAAARLANVAQPALSEQLRKLEQTLGLSLFERRSSGVVPTPGAARFAHAAQILEAGLNELKLCAASSLAVEDRPVTIGVLPSVSQHGLLVNRIAEAVLALRAEQGGAHVTVLEAPNGVLQDWATRGKVGLAIVETGPPHLPRQALGASEGLAVISHARHALMAPGPVAFAELARLPLVLPTPLFGLRQLLDAAARERRVDLRPIMEVDALAMLIAFLRHQPICTVLPPSAVRRELRSGELCAHPIVDPQVLRRLFVIYSSERSLSETERAFITLLRTGLASVEPEVDDFDSAASHPPAPLRPVPAARLSVLH